jgi:CelD/BcsL family acetyltransferase involved in cellulose biosynthesis
MNVLGGVATRTAARVVTIEPRHDGRWEQFVTAHPQALVYHLPAWLRVLRRAFSYPDTILAVEGEDGRLRGVLPLLHKRGVHRGRVLSSLPHTPVAGPIALDSDAAALLMRAAVAQAQQASSRLQLKLDGEPVGMAADLRCVPWRWAYVRDLPSDPEALRFGSARNHARIKWAAGKAARAGVRLRDADSEADLRGWYGLYLDTMRERVVPPLPYRFFRAMWHELHPPGYLRLVLAERQAHGAGRLLAGSVFLGFGETLFYAFNGRRRSGLALRPNDAIHWHVMRQACAAGFRRYDFGEVADENEGLAEFKAKWGTTPRQLYRLYYPAPHDIDAGSGRRIPGPVQTVWRRLPLRATEVLGHALYRWL